MNLAQQIRSAIVTCQPLDYEQSEEDFVILTNMILSVLSRNKLITEEKCLDFQLAMTIKKQLVKLDLYENLWDLLEQKPGPDPSEYVENPGLNREN